MLLCFLPLALAHGDGFSSAAVAIHPDDPDQIWLLTEQWGLGRTADGGETWEWLCEEALGVENIYGILATTPGEVVLATRTGLRRVASDCTGSAVGGLPDELFVPGVAAYGAGFLAMGIGADEGGLWSCNLGGCAPSELMGAGVFPKSILADQGRVWATIVHVEGLGSELWRSDDGMAWTRVYAWEAGDTDPRVLYADGDRLLVWRRTRTADDAPGLLVSDDGGASFRTVLTDGYYTDQAPALLVLDGVMLLGSEQGARTWRSEDGGETWTDVKDEVPAVRCAITVGGVGWACGDHLFDGFDLSRTEDGRTWVPVACLEEALPSTCSAPTCDPLLSAYLTASAEGGGKCDTIILPPEPLTEDADVPCGCESGGGAAALLALLSGWRRRTPSAGSASSAAAVPARERSLCH